MNTQTRATVLFRTPGGFQPGATCLMGCHTSPSVEEAQGTRGEFSKQGKKGNRARWQVSGPPTAEKCVTLEQPDCPGCHWQTHDSTQFSRKDVCSLTEPENPGAGRLEGQLGRGASTCPPWGRVAAPDNLYGQRNPGFPEGCEDPKSVRGNTGERWLWVSNLTGRRHHLGRL